MTKDRLDLLRKHIIAPPAENQKTHLDGFKSIEAPAASDYKSIRIGSVSVTTVSATNNSPLVPRNVQLMYCTDETVAHLKWLLQKYALKQDVFLLGPPSEYKRFLVLKLAELLRYEVEYVCITPDTSESDLKLRREIINGSAIYMEQPAVRAAIYGRMLILDNVQNAERNVLPILNNLLENREMSLEDGRMIISPRVYDGLLKDAKYQVPSGLVRASENFWVVALGLPVPPYNGFPLDPPFRSRFQCRTIDYPSYDSAYSTIKRLMDLNNNEKLLGKVEALLKFSASVHTLLAEDKSVLPSDFSVDIVKVSSLLNFFPELRISELTEMCYPYGSFNNLRAEHQEALRVLHQQLGIVSGLEFSHRYSIEEGKVIIEPAMVAQADSNAKSTKRLLTDYVPTLEQEEALSKMIMLHTAGLDFLLVGVKGNGKTLLLDVFSRLLGLEKITIPLYKDLVSRDLLQRRSTNMSGDTVWEYSQLVDACIRGGLVVLDGVESVHVSSIAFLGRLLSERRLDLPDGTKLVPRSFYEKINPLERSGFHPIHPRLRIVGVGRLQATRRWVKNWPNAEILSDLGPCVVPNEVSDKLSILRGIFPEFKNDGFVQTLFKFVETLHQQDDALFFDTVGLMSLRQIIRIIRKHMTYPDYDLFTAISDSTLLNFLPQNGKQSLLLVLKNLGIEARSVAVHVDEPKVSNGAVRFANELFPQNAVDKEEEALVPNVVFFNNRKHSYLLRDMFRDFKLGEHLLLMGNQGVGKNKLTDRFIQLLRYPRQYIQLHRDTTVQSLTVVPSLNNGVLQYEDSPLVKACKLGHVLVIDEADKAPVQVTSILKTLLEDGTMVLSDGRKITKHPLLGHSESGIIRVHPKFRIVMLANRPGFPFLGNDFYKEIGDAFTTYSIDNPDKDSEFALVKQYAPNVNNDLILKLIDVFDDLRKLHEEGQLSYPYSTRELVNILRHMQMFPTDSILTSIGNVFDFDVWEPEKRQLIFDIFKKHGLKNFEGHIFIKTASLVSDDLKLNAVSPHIIYKLNAPERIIPKESRLPLKSSFKATGERSRVYLVTEDLRINVFSEFKTSIKLPSIVENNNYFQSFCASLSSSMLCALTKAPCSLIMFSADANVGTEVDLFEYVGMKTDNLDVFLLKVNGGKIAVAVFNPLNNQILVFEEWRRVFSIYTIGDPSTQYRIDFSCSESQGILLCYGLGGYDVIVLDFLQQKSSVFAFSSNSISSAQHVEDLSFMLLLDDHDFLMLDIGRYTIRRLFGNMGQEFTKFYSGFAVSKQNDLFLVKATSDEMHFFQVEKNCCNDSSTIALPNGILVSLNALSGDLRWWTKLGAAYKTNILNILNKYPNIKLHVAQGSLALVDNIHCVIFLLELDPDLNQKMLRAALKHNSSIDAENNDLSVEYFSGAGSGSGTAGGEGQGSSEGGSGTSAKYGEFHGPRKDEDLSEDHFKERSAAPHIQKDVAESSKGIREAFLNSRLKQISMNMLDYNKYASSKQRIDKYVKQLRNVLETTVAKKKERVWISRQTSGDFDERRLIDGLTGEKNVYKKRSNLSDFQSVKRSPKRIFFSFDVSASMSRYNAHDGRLDRCTDVTLMIIEAFRGFDDKFSYMISGHSGDSFDVKFVAEGNPPKTENESFQIMEKMRAHAAHCISGDSTMDALKHCVDTVTSSDPIPGVEEYDDHFVIMISDANIKQYGINPDDLLGILKKNPSASSFIIFIGSLGDQANTFVERMPGKAFMCLDASELPQIIQNIFINSLIKE